MVRMRLQKGHPAKIRRDIVAWVRSDNECMKGLLRGRSFGGLQQTCGCGSDVRIRGEGASCNGLGKLHRVATTHHAHLRKPQCRKGPKLPNPRKAHGLFEISLGKA